MFYIQQPNSYAVSAKGDYFINRTEYLRRRRFSQNARRQNLKYPLTLFNTTCYIFSMIQCARFRSFAQKIVVAKNRQDYFQQLKASLQSPKVSLESLQRIIIIENYRYFFWRYIEQGTFTIIINLIIVSFEAITLLLRK